jgi:hypothetical protein
MFASFRKTNCIAAALIFELALPALAVPAPTGNPPISLLAQLRAGQTFVYQVHYQLERDMKTDSRVVAPIAPPAEPIDLLRTIRVEVLEAAGGQPSSSTRLRVQIAPSDEASSSPAKSVQFAIDAAGSVSDIEGLESLTPAERELWRDWLERFAAVWAFPQNLKPGQKWTSEESVSDSVIAGLIWQKESQYVRDEPCPHTSAILSQSAGVCAVILTKATLKQKSSSKDATPEDYKLHDLKTAGSARGSNQIISYVSRAAGVVVRATESAVQTMDVAIAKTDGSNAVRYNIEARSQSEILLTSSSAPARS